MTTHPNQEADERAVVHLRYDLITANLECGEKRHAQEVMASLGITYQHATPQSMSDQWWFWNCKGAPMALPAYLTVLAVDPMECIGWGLSRETAERIAAKSLEEKAGKP